MSNKERDPWYDEFLARQKESFALADVMMSQAYAQGELTENEQQTLRIGYATSREDWFEEKNKLQHQLEIQTKRVENLKKSNEFYADPNNYQRGSGLPHGFCIIFNSIKDDYERVKSHPVSDSFYKENLSSYGGKLARSCQAIDQELEKQLEEVNGR